MTITTGISSRVSKVLNVTQQFSSTERLLLAKLLLDSIVAHEIVAHEIEGDADWQRLGLAAFERDWDNPDDAIYDNWRELYGVSAG
jgi:hypothetical protein